MVEADRRGVRRAAVPLALVTVAAVTGCGGSHPPATAPLRPHAPATPAVSAASLLAAATAAVRRERSFHFTAVETTGAAHRTVTRVTGRLVRGGGVAYTLVVQGRRSQVVRTGRATFVRATPGPWRRLTHHPSAEAAPDTTLLAVLHGLGAARVTPAAAGGWQLAGQLAPDDARKAGIPTNGTPATVGVRLDARHRVTRVDASSHSVVGTVQVPVRLVATYGDFDRVAAIRPPA